MDEIKSIVVPTDFSQFAEAAAARAVTLARLDGASIHLVHAVRTPLVLTSPDFSAEATVSSVWEDACGAARVKLEEARKTIEIRGVSNVTIEASSAYDAVRAIENAVEAKEADLVVMGTHGRSGFKHAILGSVAERSLRTLNCPVLAVKEDLAKAEEPIKRILAAVDFSVDSDRAVEFAATLGRKLGAELDLIHAFDLPGDYGPYGSLMGNDLEHKVRASANRMLDMLLERIKESQLPVTHQIRRGRPSVVIARAAEEIGSQLIVMGTWGNSGLSHLLLGSVAERTIRSAPCSVLVVRVKGDAIEF